MNEDSTPGSPSQKLPSDPLLRRFLRLPWFLVQALILIVWFLIVSLAALLLVPFFWKNPAFNWVYARLLAKPLSWFLGYNVVVDNAHYLYSEQPCIYVGNHQSNMDIVTYGCKIFPRGAVVIGKKELRRLPLFGLFFEAAGNIVIDRKDRADAVNGLMFAKDEMKRRGISLWVFPEGTRNRGRFTMLPFKRGAFHLAIASQRPIVATVAPPLVSYFDFKNLRIRRGRIHHRVLPPFYTAGLTAQDVDVLMNRVRTAMDATFEELKAEVGLAGLK